MAWSRVQNVFPKVKTTVGGRPKVWERLYRLAFLRKQVSIASLSKIGEGTVVEAVMYRREAILTSP